MADAMRPARPPSARVRHAFWVQQGTYVPPTMAAPFNSWWATISGHSFDVDAAALADSRPIVCTVHLIDWTRRKRGARRESTCTVVVDGTAGHRDYLVSAARMWAQSSARQTLRDDESRW